MSRSLKPYVDLLARSGQIERVSLDSDALLTRGICIFIGILIGLAMAHLWTWMALAGLM